MFYRVSCGSLVGKRENYNNVIWHYCVCVLAWKCDLSAKFPGALQEPKCCNVISCDTDLTLTCAYGITHGIRGPPFTDINTADMWAKCRIMDEKQLCVVTVAHKTVQRPQCTSEFMWGN